MYQVHEELITVGEELRELGRLSEFEEQKETVHAQIVSQQQTMIQWFGVVKIFVIGAVVLGQIFVIKKYLSSSDIMEMGKRYGNEIYEGIFKM